MRRSYKVPLLPIYVTRRVYPAGRKGSLSGYDPFLRVGLTHGRVGIWIYKRFIGIRYRHR